MNESPTRRELILGGGLLGLGALSAAFSPQEASAALSNLSLSVSDVSVSTTDGTVTSVDVDGSQTDAIQLEWEGLESTDTADVELYADTPDQTTSSTTTLDRRGIYRNSTEVFCVADGNTVRAFAYSDESELTSYSYNTAYDVVGITKRESYSTQVYVLLADTNNSNMYVSLLNLDPLQEESQVQLDQYVTGTPTTFEVSSNYFYIGEYISTATYAFDKTGTFVNKTGSNGSEHMEVSKPMDGSSYVYVMFNAFTANDAYLRRYTTDLSTVEYEVYIDRGVTGTVDENCIDGKDIVGEYVYFASENVIRKYDKQINLVWEVSEGTYTPSSVIAAQNTDEIYVTESGGGMAIRSATDGSVITRYNADATPSISVSETEKYVYQVQTGTGGSATDERINQNTGSTETITYTPDTQARVEATETTETTATVNEDLLVSATVSIDTLSGSFSGTFTDVFGSNPINIPSNHADLEKSYFEEGTDGNTENTDVTFRLRVYLQNAGVEDNDSNTATYSVTNS